MTETLGEALDDPRRAHFLLNRQTAIYAVLQAVSRLGLLDLLEAPVSIGDLARKSGAALPGLARILAFLEAEGVLGVDADGIVLPNKRTAALRTLVPAIGNDRLSNMAALDLDQALREDRPAFDIHFDKSAFAYLQDNPQLGANFARLMQLTTQQAEETLLQRHSFPHFSKVVDIGGNQGTLLLQLLRGNPAAHGVLFDLPETAEKARPALDTARDGKRIEVIGGDFFAEVPEGGDLYLLKQILHDWSDEAGGQILRNIRKAIAPDGKLLVIERLIPEQTGPHPARALDILMLLWTPGGRERKLEEYRQMLVQAGFAIDQVTIDRDGQSVIEAVPV